MANQVHSAEKRPEFPPFHGTRPSTVGSPDHVKGRKGGSKGRPPKRSPSRGLGGATSSSFCGTGGLCTSSAPTATQAQGSSSSLRLGRTSSPSWDTPPALPLPASAGSPTFVTVTYAHYTKIWPRSSRERQKT